MVGWGLGVVRYLVGFDLTFVWVWVGGCWVLGFVGLVGGFVWVCVGGWWILFIGSVWVVVG